MKPKKRKEVKRSPNSRFIDIEKIWDVKQQSNNQEIEDIASEEAEESEGESEPIIIELSSVISSDNKDK